MDRGMPLRTTHPWSRPSPPTPRQSGCASPAARRRRTHAGARGRTGGAQLHEASLRRGRGAVSSRASWCSGRCSGRCEAQAQARLEARNAPPTRLLRRRARRQRGLHGILLRASTAQQESVQGATREPAQRARGCCAFVWCGCGIPARATCGELPLALMCCAQRRRAQL